jgi:hypothetical protein
MLWESNSMNNCSTLSIASSPIPDAKGIKAVKIVYSRALVLLVVCVIGPSALAHHSRAGIDQDSVEAHQGTVIRLNWTNPHVSLEIELTDVDGEWIVLTDAIPILSRSGWTAESLMPGDRVVVRANPSKDPQEPYALLVSVEKEDGTILTPRSHFDRSAGESPSRASATDLSGVWELPFGETGDFMQRWGRIALTEKGVAAQAAFTPPDRPASKCIGTPTPMLMAMPYLNEIELGDDTIVMRSEFLNAERTIYMDGRGHPENGARTNQGHSIGRWEDDILVVDTVLFEDHRAPIRGPNEGVASGAQRHVVERYTLSEDGIRVLIEFSVEDSEYLAEPFTGTLEWVYLPDFELSGLICTP